MHKEERWDTEGGRISRGRASWEPISFFLPSSLFPLECRMPHEQQPLKTRVHDPPALRDAAELTVWVLPSSPRGISKGLDPRH
eukprot:scaffold3539_cov112-Isochrysis_galbana.AAC.3